MTAHPHDKANSAAPPSPSPSTCDDSQTAQFPLLSHPEALTATLSALFQSDVTHGDSLPPTAPTQMTVFHALEAPSISVNDYITRLSKYVFCSPSCLITSVHYVSRVVSTHPNLTLSSLTVHRLFITALVLACKYSDDKNYNLAYYARVGGLPTTELANLELHMLRMLDFRLDISICKFQSLEACLVQRVCTIANASTNSIDQTLVAPLARTAYHMLNHRHIPQMLVLPTSPLRTSSSSSSVSSSIDDEHLPVHGNDSHFDDVIKKTTMQIAALTFDSSPENTGCHYHVASVKNAGQKSTIPPSSPFSGSDSAYSLSRNSSTDTLSSNNDTIISSNNTASTITGSVVAVPISTVSSLVPAVVVRSAVPPTYQTHFPHHQQQSQLPNRHHHNSNSNSHLPPHQQFLHQSGHSQRQQPNSSASTVVCRPRSWRFEHLAVKREQQEHVSNIGRHSTFVHGRQNRKNKKNIESGSVPMTGNTTGNVNYAAAPRRTFHHAPSHIYQQGVISTCSSSSSMTSSSSSCASSSSSSASSPTSTTSANTSNDNATQGSVGVTGKMNGGEACSKTRGKNGELRSGVICYPPPVHAKHVDVNGNGQSNSNVMENIGANNSNTSTRSSQQFYVLEHKPQQDGDSTLCTTNNVAHAAATAAHSFTR